MGNEPMGYRHTESGMLERSPSEREALTQWVTETREFPGTMGQFEGM